MSTDVVIVSGARTPIATAYKGSLTGVDAWSLAEVAIGAASLEAERLAKDLKFADLVPLRGAQANRDDVFHQ